MFTFLIISAIVFLIGQTRFARVVKQILWQEGFFTGSRTSFLNTRCNKWKYIQDPPAFCNWNKLRNEICKKYILSFDIQFFILNILHSNKVLSSFEWNHFKIDQLSLITILYFNLNFTILKVSYSKTFTCKNFYL